MANAILSVLRSPDTSVHHCVQLDVSLSTRNPMEGSPWRVPGPHTVEGAWSAHRAGAAERGRRRLAENLAILGMIELPKDAEV